jgi:hypothetical protein
MRGRDGRYIGEQGMEDWRSRNGRQERQGWKVEEGWIEAESQGW